MERLYKLCAIKAKNIEEAKDILPLCVLLDISNETLRYENGKVAEEIYIHNNVQIGLHKIYTHDGKLLLSSNYDKQGKLHGGYMKCDRMGEIIKECTYNHGKYDGVVFDKTDGLPVCAYRNGKYHGVARRTYTNKDGRLVTSDFCAKSGKVLYSNEYYGNEEHTNEIVGKYLYKATLKISGRLISRGYFSSCGPSGSYVVNKREMWYLNGNKRLEEKYIDIAGIPEEDIDTTGSHKKVLHGTCMEWYEDGTIKSVRNYCRGKLHGVMKIYYPSGKIEGEAFHVHGKKEGRTITYAEDGTVISDTLYSEI